MNLADLEYNVDKFNNQLYHKDSRGREIYRNTTDISQLFAKRDGKPYYAKIYNEEYYPLIDGRQVPIDDNGYKQYIKNENMEFYPIDSLENEFVLMNNSGPIYAENHGRPYYPKNSQNVEQVILNKYIYNEDGTVQYPTNDSKDPIYPIDIQGNDEWYVAGLDHKLCIAKKGNVPVYAKKKISPTKKIEFYPSDGQIGYVNERSPVYIFDEGIPIFPKDDQGNEYYLTTKDTNQIWTQGLTRYARDNQNNEVYPKDIGEYILNNKYAKKADGTVIYPLDLNNNEYTITDASSSIYPLGYPITHDGFIIITKINEKPYIVGKHVSKDDIKFVLFRNDDTYDFDFLTNIISSRIPRINTGPKYIDYIESISADNLLKDYYVTDANGNQTYQRIVYGPEMYIETTDPTQIFAKRDGEPYYAKDVHGKYYYPKINGKEITFGSYIKDINGLEHYPKDEFGNEYVIMNGLKPLYARGEFKSFYPINTNKRQQVINADYLYEKDGSVVYPIDFNLDRPIYPIDSQTNDEYYLRDLEGKYSIGKSFANGYIYAKKKNGSEFYPPDKQIAYWFDMTPIYALDEVQDPIFPKNNQNDEYYLTPKNLKSDYVKVHPNENILPRYAQDHLGNEIYPKSYINVNSFMEITLNDRYAVNAAHEFMYPLDENNNEYTLKTWDDEMNYPLDYPQTYDGFLIVCQVNGNPSILDHLSLKKENIVSLLKRHVSTDFLTNVKSTRPSRINHGPKYITLPFNINDYHFIEYTIDQNGNEKYPRNTLGSEMYRSTTDITKLFARREGKPYYAVNKHGVEFYPTINGKQIPIDEDGYRLYIKDSNLLQRYPKDEFDNEYVLIGERGVPLYAKDSLSNLYYPKTHQGTDQVIRNVYIYEIDGSVMYPVNSSNVSFYPKDDYGNEYYVKGKHGKFTIKNSSGTYQYAKKEIGTLRETEYYPFDGEIAYEDMEPLYAVDHMHNPIFPRDNQNCEYYLSHKITYDDCACANFVVLPRYAKDSAGYEIYPYKYTPQNLMSQFIMNDVYAVDSDGNPFYPLDEYNNEYTLKNETIPDEIKFPLGYPQTYDMFIIIPEINSKPYFLENVLPKVSKNCTLYELKRHFSTDYLTEIKSSRVSSINTGIPYSKGKRVSKNKNFTFVFIFCIILAVLAIFMKYYLFK